MQKLLNQYKSYLQGLQGRSLTGSRTDLKRGLQGRSLTGSRTDLKRGLQGRSLTGDPANGRVGTAKLEGASLLENIKPLSPSTIKNYLSDTKHFLSYLKNAYQEPNIKPAHITTTTIKNYLSEISKTLPSSTQKRRFSSLKHFTGFLTQTKLIDSDPSKEIDSTTFKKTTSTIKIIDTFKNHLKSEGLSTSTIKNYASDLNHFLLWATKNNKLTDKHFQSR